MKGEKSPNGAQPQALEEREKGRSRSAECEKERNKMRRSTLNSAGMRLFVDLTFVTIHVSSFC
jgi:hypothetical protein